MASKQVMHVVVVAMTLLLASCGSKMRNDFIDACTRQGAPDAKCSCVYDKLEAKYGEEALVEMNEGERMLPDFVETMTAGAAECSGADPTAALKMLGTEGSQSEKADRIVGEPIAQEPVADVPVQEVQAPPEQDPQAADDAVIGEAISIAAGSAGGEEQANRRRLATGDLNGDGRDDTAVIFTIGTVEDATSTSTEYLSAFLRQDDGMLKFAGTTPVAITWGPMPYFWVSGIWCGFWLLGSL